MMIRIIFVRHVNSNVSYIMKKIIALIILAAVTTSMGAQKTKYVFTEASDLNLIGKIIDTPNPYHRVDTVKYKGFTKGENAQVRCSAGLAVLFKTNSSTISVKPDYGYTNYATSTMGVALRGYDLYIKKDGKWLYAASKAPSDKNLEANLVLISDMPEGEKECMLYLPIYCEVNSVKIGVEQGSDLQSLESPFRYRIGIYGSSFTQGICASRAGMSYPMQLMRSTGLQFLSLGCSGNCKLQKHFAEALAAADVDAIVFDAFSNPSAGMIENTLFPFIEIIQKSHPDIPLIFQQTIYRETRNFNAEKDASEAEKMAMAEKMMKLAMEKYKNVYFIVPNAASATHDTSVDGTHPGDYGYWIWAESVRDQIVEILAKYDIK